MKPSSRRAYAALDIGPVWLARRPAGAVDQPDVPVGAALPSDAATRFDAATPPDTVAPPDAAGAAAPDWDQLAAQVAACQACGLCQTRKQTVFGVGPKRARWMLIGEAPGAEEDERGEPFVGKAGRLLDQMLLALGLTRRDDVFIANVLKCRPPGNRDPRPDEVAQCEPFLMRQLALVDPAIVVLLGRFAAQSMLRSESSIASLRGRVHRIRVGERDIPAVVTYHPAYLLRTPADKAKAWRDLLLARGAMRNAGD